MQLSSGRFQFLVSSFHITLRRIDVLLRNKPRLFLQFELLFKQLDHLRIRRLFFPAHCEILDDMLGQTGPYVPLHVMPGIEFNLHNSLIEGQVALHLLSALHLEA